jgi:hypothetical protein
MRLRDASVTAIGAALILVGGVLGERTIAIIPGGDDPAVKR